MENRYQYFMNIEENDQEIANLFRQLHGDKWRGTMKNVLHEMTFHYPVVSERDIRNLQVPMMLVNGSNTLHEVESVSYVKKINSDIEIGLVPYAGHTANMEQPQLYNQILDAFLNKIRD
ncbi:alpha/beta hydrolase [Bacillus carboniphilus]|uniref:Alpha/beta hydrolase n=1 Tax=Bacillus carboniphilus TaxID=86663 RepID=A0ABY9JS37_9BACI|nr:alpha/beta hydrolase [Bacillus carboniphilus]WLR42214.1 alpha/beta hydrolase [Bacillus carboniphilus]